MPAIRSIILLTVFAVAAGCGGSTANNDDNQDDGDTVIINSIPNLDGEIKAAGTINNATDDMNIGLLPTGAQCRSFVTFDLTQFNVNDNVTGAGVSLPFVSQTGSPFTVLGDIIVEDVDIAGSLTPGDYDLPLVHGVSSLNRFTHVADVGTIVQAAISAGQNRITFRFRFFSLVAPVGTFITYAQSENPLPPPFLSVSLGEPNV